MTPTMEEVAGWLRKAGKRLRIFAEGINEMSQGEEYKSQQLNFADLYLDLAAQVEAMGWRPISECPKNGTYIDLWDSRAHKRLTDCRWDGNNRWVRWDKNAFGVMAWYVVKGKISHFMHRPQPPVKK